MTAIELLTLITQALVISLSVVTLIQFARQRDAIRRDIALTFLALATPNYIQVIVPLVPGLSVGVLTALGFISFFALLAQPFLMLSLLRYFRPVPPRLIRAGFVAILLSWGGIYLIYRERSLLLTFLIVAYFVVVDGYVMVSFIRGALSTSGVTRQRLRFAALGCGLLSVILIIAGLQVFVPTIETVSPPIALLLAIGTGLAFYIGFAPPRWLSWIWQFGEFQAFLMDTNAERALSETDNFDALCRVAQRAVGGFAAAVIQPDDSGESWTLRCATDQVLLEPIVRAGNDTFKMLWQKRQPVALRQSKGLCTAELRLLANAGAGVMLLVPIASSNRQWGLLAVFLRDGSLFVEEDLRFLRLLVQQSAIMLDNNSMVEQLQSYSHQLEGIIEERTAALRESEERFRQIIDTAQEGIWVFDSDHYTTLVNPKMEDLLGYPAAEMLGKPLAAYVDDDITLTVGAMNGDPAILPPSPRHEVKLRRKDGADVWTQLAISSLPDPGGQFAGTLAMVVDISERRQAEEEIRTLNTELERRVAERTAELSLVNQELETFSYSVSHDLRAPLRAIHGFSQILLEDYAEQLDIDGQLFLNRICDASKRMGQLIDGLLELSRISRGELQRQRANLSQMVHSLVTELREQQPERRVEVITQDGLFASGDERLLRIALGNLLNNAWKYSHKKPEACVEFGITEHQGKQAYFVRDNGAGFDMAYSDKLFGAFQRLHQDSEFEGSGIGLATVQRIFARHGGDIWADAAVDRGATFYFTLAEPAQVSTLDFQQDSIG